MPIAYRIDRASRCIFTRAEGLLTDEELLEHAQSVERDPNADPLFDEVVDLRAVKGFGPSRETMRETADILRTGERSRGRGRIAIVAPSDAGFGSGRMFAVLSGEDLDRVRTFRDAEEAYTWLELPRPDAAEA